MEYTLECAPSDPSNGVRSLQSDNMDASIVSYSNPHELALDTDLAEGTLRLLETRISGLKDELKSSRQRLAAQENELLRSRQRVVELSSQIQSACFELGARVDRIQDSDLRRDLSTIVLQAFQASKRQVIVDVFCELHKEFSTYSLFKAVTTVGVSKAIINIIEVGREDAKILRNSALETKQRQRAVAARAAKLLARFSVDTDMRDQGSKTPQRFIDATSAMAEVTAELMTATTGN